MTRPNLNGWEASFEGKMLPLIGIVGDVAGHYGSQNFTEVTPNGPVTVNVTGHEQEYLFGPRLSVPVGKFTPFAEAFVGVAHIHTGGSLPTPSNTSFAYAFGGGLDYRIIRPIALRVEGDYLRTSFFSTNQNNFRLGVGVVVPLLRANIESLQAKAGFSWLAESCFLWPRQNLLKKSAGRTRRAARYPVLSPNTCDRAGSISRSRNSSRSTGTASPPAGVPSS